MLWIKMNKNNTHFENDLYIRAIYNSPFNSSYTKKETWILFTQDFSQNDYVIIGAILMHEPVYSQIM